MIRNSLFENGDGKDYFVSSDGTITEITAQGWNKFDGEWYYLDGGNMVRNNSKIINGKEYYFDHTGRMVTNERIWRWNDQYNVSENSRTNSSGVLIKDAWYRNAKDEWFYYDSKGVAYSDVVVTIQGKVYAFDYDGKMRTNTIVNDS